MSSRCAAGTAVVFLSALGGPAVIAGPDPATAGRIEAVLRGYAEAGHFSGCVLVARGDEVLFEGAYGPANREWAIPLTTDTRFLVGSVSKGLTAVTVLQLVQAGKLSLETRLSEILPEFPSEQGERITIRHLLTHTSGIGHYDQVPEFERSLERLPHTPAEMIRYIGGIGLLFQPGERFGYSSFGYDLLAFACERQEGRPFAEILRERVFAPAGMSRTRLVDFRSIEERRASGYEYDLVPGFQNASFFDGSNAVGGGGVLSTVGDLHRWVRALSTGRLLGEPWRSEALRGQARVDASRAYGYGWFVSPRPDGRAGEAWHTGSTNGFASFLSFSPADGHLIVLLSNVRSNVLGGNRRYKLETLRDDIRFALEAPPPPPPLRSAAMEVARVALDEGGGPAADAYRRLKRDPGVYCFDELEVNSLGLQLFFKAGRPADAIAVLALNIEEHPESYNVYDSLGYVLHKEGRTAEAVDVYRRGFAVFDAHPQANESYRADFERAVKLVADLEGQPAGALR
jgi:CubicO group peptidase (beta-lactamase class C family)